MHDQDEASYEQIIGGRYALYGPIASGGMATVHFGRQLGAAGFARTVAIKRLKGEFLESHELISTLLDEARLASRIRHPNVVATMDMVAAEDEIFLVMEYVVGESLSRLLTKLHRSQQRVETKVATGILCGVLHALHAAHEATDERGEPMGIVHRDVSPQNVLVGADGLARLLDFGIAKGKGRLQTTRAGQLKGKVSYMAPEQILGEEPDRRSDIYAASVVLWEVLTGRRLFPTDGTAADSFKLIPKILEAEIEPPSEVADVPRALDGIVMRGLNRERDARYATARELAVALEDIIGVATNRQTGDWVERVAAEELAARAKQVQDLETRTLGADRRSVERIADATVKRRRRKRLASKGEDVADKGRGEPGPDIHDPPTEVEGPVDSVTTPGMRIADHPTEVEDDDAEHDEEALKVTRVAGGMADAAKRAREHAENEKLRETKPRVGVEDEDLRATQHWRRGDDDEAEVPTRVRKHPGKKRRLDIRGSEPIEDEPVVREETAKPSDLRPRDRPPRDRPPRDRPPESLDGEELSVPVRSTNWLALLLVIAAVVAAIAAVVKMSSP